MHATCPALLDSELQNERSTSSKLEDTCYKYALNSKAPPNVRSPLSVHGYIALDISALRPSLGMS